MVAPRNSPGLTWLDPGKANTREKWVQDAFFYKHALAPKVSLLEMLHPDRLHPIKLTFPSTFTPCSEPQAPSLQVGSPMVHNNSPVWDTLGMLVGHKNVLQWRIQHTALGCSALQSSSCSHSGGSTFTSSLVGGSELRLSSGRMLIY